MKNGGSFLIHLLQCIIGIKSKNTYHITSIQIQAYMTKIYLFTVKTNMTQTQI